MWKTNAWTKALNLKQAFNERNEKAYRIWIQAGQLQERPSNLKSLWQKFTEIDISKNNGLAPFK